jgi:ribulose-bisphosphate carboxylase large chain
MTIKEMFKTLNSHQQAYVNLELPDPKNGEYMLACFHMLPGKNLNMLQVACEVASESST